MRHYILLPLLLSPLLSVAAPTRLDTIAAVVDEEGGMQRHLRPNGRKVGDRQDGRANGCFIAVARAELH